MKTLASKSTALGACIQWTETDSGECQIRNAHSGRVVADLTSAEMQRELANMPPETLTQHGRAWLLKQREVRHVASVDVDYCDCNHEGGAHEQWWYRRVAEALQGRL